MPDLERWYDNAARANDLYVGNYKKWYDILLKK